jgi:propanol-preferring alcohol dehydrogenase
MQVTTLMQAVRYLGPMQNFELKSVAIPMPGRGQVRVKIAACGVCRTELHLRDGLLDLGRRDFTVGHEIAGTIDSVGEGVSAERIGQRVVVYYYEGCGACRSCRDGDEQLCPTPASQPGFTSDGGYAGYIVVRARNCVVLPPEIPLTHAAPLGCAGSTAVHAGKLARLVPGDWAVIHGFGGVGMATLQYAAACGARTIAIGLGAARLQAAREMGAAAVIDAAATPDVAAEVAAITGEGADAVFDLVGTAASMGASAAMLRRRGRLVLIGYTEDQFSIHPVALIVREIAVLGSVGSTLTDLHDAVDLVARGLMRPVIDRTMQLADFADALSAVESQDLTGRIVLTP